MEFLYQDEHFFAIDKPAGHFVHPPERSRYPVPREKISLYALREKLQREVFPVHRLDAPTSGVVLFANSREDARELNFLFSERRMHKSYVAVVRGHTEESGVIEHDLDIDDGKFIVDAKTEYSRLSTVEYPVAVGKKYPTARYSLVQVHPITGRWHQIRRHFDRIAHPLLGDIEHGDSYHNRFFRDELKISGLCLRATQVSFVHPWTGNAIEISAGPSEKWSRIYSEFKYAPAF